MPSLLRHPVKIFFFRTVFFSFTYLDLELGVSFRFSSSIFLQFLLLLFFLFFFFFFLQFSFYRGFLQLGGAKDRKGT